MTPISTPFPKLTLRQQAILSFIHQHLQLRQHPPTRAEIAAHFKFSSPNAAEAHLRALERKGAISMQAGTARGIRVLPTADSEQDLATDTMAAFPPKFLPSQRQPSQLSIVGRVAAGSPILATENIESECPIDGLAFHPRADYLLRVRGTSMRNAGIFDGDLLAVARCQEVQNGEIAVVRIGEEVTVKRVEKRGQFLRLHAENPAFSPIDIDLAREDVSIEGRAVGLVRPFPHV